MSIAMVWSVRAAGFAVALGVGMSLVGRAQGTNEAQRIDLVTVLRLAGTQNIEIQIAREQFELADVWSEEFIDQTISGSWFLTMPAP